MNFSELLKSRFCIAAHRGARSLAPENTMSALKKSMGHCDFIEVDVQLSRDGVCVIMHDDTLKRTTNVSSFDEYSSRKPYKVYDFSYEELSGLDYGSWYDGEYEGLLSLESALEFVKEYDLFINVEIKDLSEAFNDDEVVSKVMGLINYYGLEDKVLISSFRHRYLVLCKKICSSVATAALAEKHHPDDLLKYLKGLKVDAYHISDEMADRKTLKLVRDAGIFVNVYTINSKARRKKLLQMGANGVFSDILD